MGECHSGRVESDLDYGMQYIWDRIGATLAGNKTTWGVGIIGLRTDDTDNPLESTSDEYDNIAVLKPLGPIEISHLNDLKKKLVSSDTDKGDAVSAIVLAVHLIDEFTTLKSGKPGKYTRKIVLLTDGQGQIEDDDIAGIADKINESGIDLVVM